MRTWTSAYPGPGTRASRPALGLAHDRNADVDVRVPRPRYAGLPARTWACTRSECGRGGPRTRAPVRGPPGPHWGLHKIGMRTWTSAYPGPGTRASRPALGLAHDRNADVDVRVPGPRYAASRPALGLGHDRNADVEVRVPRPRYAGLPARIVVYQIGIRTWTSAYRQSQPFSRARRAASMRLPTPSLPMASDR